MTGFRWTIKRKLLALGAATLLPLLLLLVFWAWWEIREHTKDAEGELLLAGQQAASQVELVLDTVTHHLRALAQNQAVQRRQIGETEQLFREVTAEHSELEGLIAVSADGRTFASVPEPPAAQISFADRPWFKQVMATGQPVVGDFLIGRIRGQPVAVVAVPLGEGDGPPTGALAAGVSLRRLHLLFQSLTLLKERSVTVLDGEGKVLSHVPKGEGWIGRPLPSVAALPGGPAVVKKLAWFEGGERVVAVSPVAGTGWRVLAGVPQGSLQARVWSEVLAIGLPLLGLLAVSSLVTLLIAQRVWRPLRALADAAKKLPQGELRAIQASTTDEVGDLALAFNAMGELVTETKAKLERRVSELAALFETGQLFSQTLDLPTVLTRLADLAQSRLGVDVARIWLYDETHKTLVPGADAGLLRADARFQRRPAEGLSGWVMSHRVSLVVPDVQSESRAANVDWMRAEGIASYLGVPLLVGKAPLGVLACYSRERHDFAPQEAAFARALAAQAAVAAQNARLFQDSERRRRTAEAFASITRALSSTLNLTQVLKIVARETARVIGAERCSINLWREEHLVPVMSQFADGHADPALWAKFKTMGPYRLEEAPAHAEAIRTKRPVVVEDAAGSPLIPAYWVEAFGVRSILVVPLVLKEEVIGTLNLDQTEGPYRWREEQIDLAMTIASRAALAVENARLFDEARRLTEALTEQNRQRQLLHDAQRALIAKYDLASLLQYLVGTAAELIGARYGALAVFGEDEKITQFYTTGIDAETRERMGSLPEGRGLLGVVLRENEVLRLEDLTADPRAGGFPPHHPPMRRLLAAPIRLKDRPLGAIYLTDKDESYTPEDQDLLTTLCADAAVAIENARLVQELNRALEELRATQQQLVRSETLRAVGVLASGAAHHLNNLLAVILGNIQLLLEGVRKPEIRQPLELVEQTTLDAAEVVRRMQRFSRVEPFARLVTVDLNALAREVLELARPLWQDEAQARGVQIEAALDPGEIPAVTGEPAALREVLMNLLINAVEALPEGGKITVKTWQSGPWVHCSVTDSGVGMSDSVRERAMEPFFTTKGPKSTGLGVSVSYGIIQRHGGELAIESAEGRGTTATIRLPLTPVTTGEKREPPTEQAHPLGILLIEDEAKVRETLARLLASQGHRVIQAAGGQEGLARLEAGEPVDLVLTDLGMPGMTGWEVARAVKAQWPHLPVGLITGWGNEPEGSAEDRSAADFVIPKPVTLEALRKALAGWRPEPAKRDGPGVGKA